MTRLITRIDPYLAVLFLCESVFLPQSASALTTAEVYDSVSPLLYGAIGFFGAVSFLIFGAGFILYLVRMGLDNRVEGIDYMNMAVTILFVVTILVGIVAWIE